jgi:mRNA interferase RelE/StbE
MKYRVEVENRAARQIGTLEPRLRDRVLDALEILRDEPRPSGCSKLKGRTQPTWRIRVGDYRILYRIHDDQKLVRVYGVLRRDEAY